MQGERAFKAIIQTQGKTSFLPIPFDPDQEWGAKARHNVAGTIQGRKIRGPLTRVGDSMGLSLGPSWLRDNAVTFDSPIDVVLWPEGPQSALLADDISAAFEEEPQAAAFFDAMPTFYRKNLMRWIDGAKRPETRAARIRETIQLMKEGKREK